MGAVAEIRAVRKQLSIKHLTVTACLLGLIVVLPFVSQTTANIVLLAAVTVSAWLVSGNGRKTLIPILILGTLGIGLVVMEAVVPAFRNSFLEAPFGHLVIIVMLALFAYCVLAILQSLLKATHVSTDEIAGGINIYLIIGFIWAHFYHLLERVSPHSFNIELAGEELFDRLVYFSFVTLTTLGYGDVTPQGSAAEVLVMLEAIVGQMYVPVFVTYLLSVHIGQRTSGPNQGIM